MSNGGVFDGKGRNSTSTDRNCRNVSGTIATPKPADTNPRRLSAPSASCSAISGVNPAERQRLRNQLWYPGAVRPTEINVSFFSARNVSRRFNKRCPGGKATQEGT